jgi:hypothetical protein
MKTIKYYIDGVGSAVWRREMAAPGSARQPLQNRGAGERGERPVQVDAVHLNFMAQRGVDRIVQRTSADGVGAVRKHDQNFLGVSVAVL